MFHRGLTYMLCAMLAVGFANPAIAQDKKKKSSGIIKKVVVAYVVYKVVQHYKDKKEEQKEKNKPKDQIIEPYYDEDCEDEDECEEE